MSRVEWCSDGVSVALEADGELRLILLRGSEQVADFPLDPSELRGLLDGRLTLQFSDGVGNGVSVHGEASTLKVRIEAADGSRKNCRIAPENMEETRRSLNHGV